MPPDLAIILPVPFGPTVKSILESSPVASMDGLLPVAALVTSIDLLQMMWFEK